MHPANEDRSAQAIPEQRAELDAAVARTQAETDRLLGVRAAAAGNESTAGDELARWEGTWLGRLPDVDIIRMAEGVAARARQRIAEEQRRQRVARRKDGTK